MPHKHRIPNSNADVTAFDLPPNKIAQPRLHTKTPISGKKPGSAKSALRSEAPKSQHYREKDTPRAFTRLLGGYRPPRAGEDDGIKISKKRKRAQTQDQGDTPGHIASHSKSARSPETAALKIQPGEPMSQFSARVNAALPFAGLAKAKSTSVTIDPVSRDPVLRKLGKGYKTRTEKKMQKMQAVWREEERVIKEKKLQEDDEAAVVESGAEEMGVDEIDAKGAQRSGQQKGRRKAKKDMHDEEDIWKVIETDRRTDVQRTTARTGDRGSGPGLVGLHDVVQAPPRFKHSMSSEKLTAKSNSGVGLKRQVELSDARRSVVEGYRAMMRQKRDALVVQ